MLSLCALVPFAGFWLLCFTRISEKRGLSPQIVGAVASALTALIAFSFWIKFTSVGAELELYRFTETASWFTGRWVEYTLGVDGLSIFFIALTAVLTAMCLAFSARSTAKEGGLFVGLFLLMEALLILAFSSLTLLGFYVFFEATLIPMFLIVIVWGSRSRKVRAAYYLFYYTLCGSVLILFCILYLYSAAGSTHPHHIGAYSFLPTEQALLWGALFVGLGVKVPVIPFHIWLPEAHVEAPTGGSVMLAGLLLKLGGYGFVRFAIPMFVKVSFYFAPLVLVVGSLSVVYGSLTTLRQIDLKKIIAYSSVAHMNLGLLGLFALNPQALGGGLALMVGHGLVSGGLFFAVGVLYDRHHTRAVRYYGGLTQAMPVFSGVFLFLSLANMGLPGTSNFIGEVLVFVGLLCRSPLSAVLASVGMVLAAGYSLWLHNRVNFGSLKLRYLRSAVDLTRGELGVCALLCVLSALMGMYPAPVLRVMWVPVSWALGV